MSRAERGGSYGLRAARGSYRLRLRELRAAPEGIWGLRNPCLAAPARHRVHSCPSSVPPHCPIRDGNCGRAGGQLDRRIQPGLRRRTDPLQPTLVYRIGDDHGGNLECMIGISGFAIFHVNRPGVARYLDGTTSLWPPPGNVLSMHEQPEVRITWHICCAAHFSGLPHIFSWARLKDVGQSPAAY